MISYPKAILLDIDNTVYPYSPCHLAGIDSSHKSASEINKRWKDYETFVSDYNNARKAVKVHTTGQAAEHSRLLYFKHLIETRMGRINIKDVIDLHEAYWQGYFRAMEIDPGCLDFLQYLHSHKIKLAWVSNLTTEIQMLKLIKLGVEDYADFLITSEEAGADKPDPGVVEIALEKLGMKPSDVWMAGDDFKGDVGLARKMGITAVWFRRGKNKTNDFQADIIVDNWFDLKEVLENERVR